MIKESISKFYKENKKFTIISIIGVMLFSIALIVGTITSIKDRNDRIINSVEAIETTPLLHGCEPADIMNKADADFYRMSAETKLDTFYKYMKNKDYASACAQLSKEDFDEIRAIFDKTQNNARDARAVGEIAADVGVAYYSKPLKVIPKSYRSDLVNELEKSAGNIASNAALAYGDKQMSDKAEEVKKILKQKSQDEKDLQKNYPDVYNKIRDGKNLTYEVTVRQYDIESNKLFIIAYKKELNRMTSFKYADRPRAKINSIINEKTNQIDKLEKEIKQLETAYENKYKGVSAKEVVSKKPNDNELVQVRPGNTTNSNTNTVTTKQSSETAKTSNVVDKNAEVPCEANVYAIPTDGASVDTPKQNRYYFKKNETTYFRLKSK